MPQRLHDSLSIVVMVGVPLWARSKVRRMTSQLGNRRCLGWLRCIGPKHALMSL